MTTDEQHADRLYHPTPEHVAIVEVIYDMAVALATLDRLTAAHVEELPIEQASNHLIEIQAVLTTLHRIEAAYMRWIYAIFKDQGWRTGHDHPHQVDGVGSVEAGRSKTTHWNSEAAAKEWLEAFMKRHEGNADPYVLIPELLRALGIIKQDGTYATSHSWRKGPLTELGIDTDAHTWDTYGPPRVKITKDDSADA